MITNLRQRLAPRQRLPLSTPIPSPPTFQPVTFSVASAVRGPSNPGVWLSGNVLSIYDSSDAYAGSCEGIFALSEGKGLGQHEELVLHLGTGHGILYEPLSEWVLPTVQWANQEW